MNWISVCISLARFFMIVLLAVLLAVTLNLDDIKGHMGEMHEVGILTKV